ncbi:type VI secretion protein [Streptomyces sp. NPDC095613]|uniref:type VI secretion protein n=1 Tax=Streptomyces sp. NPDC095613 TaxID=3155540 RepID=UPI003328BC9F
MARHHDGTGPGAGSAADGRGGRQGGGVPDGLLVGLLGFLLGLTLLVWTATGLAGLLTHGGWPENVTFTRTPMAMRELASAPHDLPAAWPEAPPGELSGYGLFWGLLISQLMVLTVLTVFVLGVTARYRVVRARRREQAAAAAMTRGRPAKAAEPPHGTAWEAAPAAQPTWQGPTGPESAGTAGPRTATDPPTTVTSATTASSVTGASAAPSARPAPPVTPTSVVHPAPLAPPVSYVSPVSHTTPGAAIPAASPTASPSSEPFGNAASFPTLPGVRYGDAAARRPTALQAVLDAAGPALVVTSDPTLWAETKDARAKLGPVLLHDPGHRCDTPARLHWSPATGCEDPGAAGERAIALLAPVRPHALLDAAVADTAETLLRCWLHAAAVDGRPFKQVHRWAQGTGTRDAVRILRTHPKAASGLAGLLESALTAYPERRDQAQQLTARALPALSSVHVREACTTNRTDSLALDSFAREGGTLYVVGEPIEDPRSRPGAMPLLTALASYVVEHGRRMAARSSDGRLDPPMTLVLDDVAAVAPLPRLPELLATGQDRGLPTLALLRSRQQAKDRWPQHDLPEPPPVPPTSAAPR